MYRFLKAANIRQIAQNTSRIQKLLIIVSALAVISSIIWFTLSRHNTDVENLPDISSSPDYATILPEKKSIDDLGGWTRVSPENADPVYAYVDSIDEVSVSISQQPLPETFKSNLEGQTKQLAESYGATTALTAEDKTTFYIGTSSKGPQSVIFTKDSVLVLMKSQSKIPDQAWKRYISSLSS